jgi:ubiquinone/menaquinone biosynthesis C-methylase UbiE
MSEDLKYCPICNSDIKTILYPSKNIVRCESCGVIYLDKKLSEEKLKEFYQKYADGGSHMRLPDNDDAINNTTLNRHYMMNKILKYKSSGKILDIGCGWGAFLNNARKNNFEVYGLEICKKMKDYGTNHLHISISDKDFLDESYDENFFDVIIFNHSLEHLPKQKNVFEKVNRILKTGGLFCGIVPNFNSVCSKFYKENWYWLDSNYHYIHYTPNSLKSTMKSFKFKCLEQYTDIDDYTLSNINEAINNLYGYNKDESDVLKYKRKKLERMNLGEAIIFFYEKESNL